MDDETKAALSRWAAQTRAISKLWLFGSRARGDHRPDSDFDFAIELMPKAGSTDWAFFDFIQNAGEWKNVLRHIVGTEVSLVPVRDDLKQGEPFDPRVMLIWERS
jgi:predicted nucleotidyltransferase